MDTTYFNQINTAEKAYTLGLLFADGWNDLERGYVGLQLSGKQDLAILEQIKNNIGLVGNVQYIKARKETHSDSYRLNISSKEISDALNSLGCTPRKSLTLQFPNINQELLSHFIRGYFDGDGSITQESRNGVRTVSILGTQAFILQLDKFINQILGFNGLIRQRNKVYEYRLIKREYVVSLLSWLYGGSSMHLERKYDRFQEILERCRNAYAKKIRDLVTV